MKSTISDTPHDAMAWTLDVVGGHPPGELGDVWIAPPLEVGGDHLVIAGHVAKGDQNSRIRIYQAHVLLAETEAAPGFRVAVPLSRGLYRLELWHRDARLGQWDAIPDERDRVARALAPDPPITQDGPYAIPGRMGELFLAGDTNDSVGQFTQTRGLSLASAEAWQRLFDQFDPWCRQFDLQHLSALVAPAKEEILREYYPFPRAGRTVLDDFIARFRDRPVIFPKWELWNRRHFAYCTTDTHWTDYGASVAAQAVLTAWGIASDGLPDTFRIHRRIGDLGNKVTPPISGFEPVFLTTDRPAPVFDNNIDNQGCLRIWRSEDAPIRDGLLIFGDSFGTNLAEALAGVFQQVSFAYQPAGFDPALVNILRPRHVLLQITQRFMHGQPATGAAVLDKSRAKMAAMPPQARAALRAHLSGVAAEFQPLVAPLLEP